MRDWLLLHPVVIDRHQQEHKYVRHPQVHFVCQTIGGLFCPDRFQRLPNFFFRYAALTLNCFRRLEAGEVDKIGIELSRTQSGIPSEDFLEVVTTNSQQMPSYVVRRCLSDDMSPWRMS